jgi:hypothetical protein
LIGADVDINPIGQTIGLPQGRVAMKYDFAEISSQSGPAKLSTSTALLGLVEAALENRKYVMHVTAPDSRRQYGQHHRTDMERAMNTTKHDNSQRWVHLKQQYAQWRRRVETRRMSRHVAEEACARFWI